MIAVATAGAVYALYDSSDAHHVDFVRLFQRHDLSIIVPDLVLPEADYLIRRHLGPAAQRDFLEGLTQGFFTLESPAPSDWPEAERLIRENPGLGLAEASAVALAVRLNADALLAADARRIRPLKTERRLLLLPADL